KRGFHNLFRRELATVNLSRLEALGLAAVTPEVLLERRVIRHVKDGVKILAGGELTRPLEVTAHAFSRAAKEKIERAGGKAILMD
ncbi:MAG: uL15 family ribosomal protein, partial [Terriglobales bacterium]